MQFDMTYARATELAEHLIAIGDTDIRLRNDEGFPYSKVSRVEEGGTWRLGAPVSVYLVAQDQGLTFKLSVDFETKDANGRGVSMIDRDKMRELMVKLPALGREALATMLEDQALPAMAKRTAEIRNAMSAQLDSEECVRGLIAFAREDMASARVEARS